VKIDNFFTVFLFSGFSHTVASSDTPTPVGTENSNQNSTPSQEAATQGRTRRKTDPAWEYCTQIMEGGRKKIKCMYCNATFLGGGIHRFKEHLAKYPGNVVACKKVDPEVEHTMYQNIEDWNEKKKKMQQDYVEGHPYGPEPGEEDVVEVSNTNATPSVGVAAAAASTKGKKDLLLLLVLASTSSLELDRGSTNN
jgi:hypothetical protein